MTDNDYNEKKEKFDSYCIKGLLSSSPSVISSICGNNRSIFDCILSALSTGEMPTFYKRDTQNAIS